MENMAGLLEKRKFMLDFNEFMEGFFWRGKGRSLHADGLKTKKVQEPTVESRVQGILRPMGIRSRAENMGGNVKLTTVTELRLSRVHDTFTAECSFSLHS